MDHCQQLHRVHCPVQNRVYLQVLHRVVRPVTLQAVHQAVCQARHQVTYLQDYQAQPYQLHYLRTKDQKEVDFALVHNDKLCQIIEVKLSDTRISPTLNYFAHKYQLPATQVVYTNKPEYQQGLIQLRQLTPYLNQLWPNQADAMAS